MYDSAPEQPQNKGILGRTADAFGVEHDSRDAASPRFGMASPQAKHVPKACAEGSGEAALGRDAKYVGRSGRDEHRKSLFYQQKHAAKLLPEERVKNCKWAMQRLDQPIEVHVHEGRASYSGLQTCGSVWLCPICSRKISEVRRTELNDLLAWTREKKHIPVMLTLTARHTRHDALSDQLAKMKSAKRRLRQRRDWKNLKDRIVGTVTATEVTHGERAGWHTHFHEIIIVRADDEAEAVAIVSGLRNGWLVSLVAEGLDGLADRAFQVQGAAAAGNYIGKWGAAEEVALAGQKKGRQGGRTAAQLLHDAAINKDERAGQLWAEFGKVFKGSRQLVWSNGLKAMAGIEDVEDEAAAEDGVAELKAVIDHSTWRGWSGYVGARYRRVRILEAAEKGDVLHVAGIIHGQLQDEDMSSDPLIEPREQSG